MSDSSNISSTSPIRVMLVDDHLVVRSGVAAFLRSYDNFEVVAEASNGTLAIALCKSTHPDVIIMDLHMPRMDGITATRIICERYPEIRVIILSSVIDKVRICEALQAGAVGYLLKTISAEELADAICEAYCGRITLASEATEALIQAAFENDTVSLGNDLTKREHEVLDLLAQGLDNNRIAEILVVSSATVKFHVSNILAKLHKENRTEVAAFALEHHLVSSQS
jgi:NarL family two-component system response regulator LiaR